MKTNSNSYTIVYSVILVLIVAFLLAFVFQALKPMQDANVQLDQQKQILFALNQDRNMTNEQAVQLTMSSMLTVKLPRLESKEALMLASN